LGVQPAADATAVNFFEELQEVKQDASRQASESGGMLNQTVMAVKSGMEKGSMDSRLRGNDARKEVCMMAAVLI
jgi:hypothetical protein